MSQLPFIESPQNPRIKALAKLRKAKARRETGTMLVEGRREIRRALESGWRFEELYLAPEPLLPASAASELERLAAGVDLPVFRCSEAAFRKIAYRDAPDGAIARSPLAGVPLDALELSKNPLVVIVENPEKPGNLGAILRTADAAGADAVVVCGDAGTDLNHPNVVRAAMGTLFFLPVAEASTAQVLDWLRRRDLRILPAFPDAPTNYDAVDLRSGVAFVLGAEAEGLSNAWRRPPALPVSIPMNGRNDSLNVSTAAAVLLYEALRQRKTLPSAS